MTNGTSCFAFEPHFPHFPAWLLLHQSNYHQDALAEWLKSTADTFPLASESPPLTASSSPFFFVGTVSISMAVLNSIGLTALFFLAAAAVDWTQGRRSTVRGRAQYHKYVVDQKPNWQHLAANRWCPEADNDIVRMIISTKHKTGTELTLFTLISLYLLTKAPIGAFQHHRQGALQTCLHNATITEHWDSDNPPALVSITRSPMDIVASAYIYHLKGPEAWVVEPIVNNHVIAIESFAAYVREIGADPNVISLQDILVDANISKALELSVELARLPIEGMLEEMRALANVPNGHVLTLDDFATDFDGTVAKIESWAGVSPRSLVKEMAQYNVYNKPRRQNTQHVHLDAKSLEQKQKIRNMFLTLPAFAPLRALQSRYEELLDICRNHSAGGV